VNLKQAIEVLLLSRNNKEIRLAAAHLVKGVWESGSDPTIVESMLSFLPSLSSHGINSSEFLAVLGFIAQDKKEVVESIKREIVRTNERLISHPNLEIYSTIQKQSEDHQVRGPLKGSESRGARFMLELEPCNKCFESRSQPFNQ